MSKDLNAFRKEQIIKKLIRINNDLYSVYEVIKRLNPDDGSDQFDFATNPKIAEMADHLQRRSKMINDIVYQKA